MVSKALTPAPPVCPLLFCSIPVVGPAEIPRRVEEAALEGEIRLGAGAGVRLVRALDSQWAEFLV